VKLLAVSPLVLVTAAAVSPGDVWAVFADGLTNLIAVAVLVAGLWASIGRPIKKRFDEERKERLEEKHARMEREKAIDNAFEDQRRMTADWREEYGKNEADKTRILEELKTNVGRHDSIIEDHGKQLSYLRGKEDARREIAQNAVSVAQLVHDASKQEEETPHDPN
jgi:FtsZ-interacting cell division protein ZipA